MNAPEHQEHESSTHDAFAVNRLDFELPDELIATVPPATRDASRLLHLNKHTGEKQDRLMTEFIELLQPGDLLVMNNTKVLKAKFTSFRSTGGRIPGLFLQEMTPDTWLVMLEGAGKVAIGETLTILPPRPVREQTDTASPEEPDQAGGLDITMLDRRGEGQWLVKVDAPQSAEATLDLFGSVPLPPYILKRREATAHDHAKTSDTPTPIDDTTRYQTVYASQPGAVAAPTAGLHLTPELLEQCLNRGIKTAEVTLHVGVGTFRPVKSESLQDHTMHGERFVIDQRAADAISHCRTTNGRVIAIGTTTVRVLETVAADLDKSDPIMPAHGVTHAFIFPPYAFKCVDALLTNFHLPRSTLIAMVMALAGEEEIRNAYHHAIDQRYRFYSYGDAMFIS